MPTIDTGRIGGITPAKQLAIDITQNHLQRDSNGNIQAPNAPGLGMIINTDALQKYLVPVEIKVSDKLLYATPNILDLRNTNPERKRAG